MRILNKQYIDGWYFKHQKDKKNICFFIGRDKEKAFLQVITNELVKIFEYKTDKYKFYDSVMQIRIGDSLFAPQGCVVMAKDKDMSIRGRLTYGRLTYPKFSMCQSHLGFSAFGHSVLSFDHNVMGSLELNDEKYDMCGSKGYIEYSKGRKSEKQLWCQSNSFENKTGIMIYAEQKNLLGVSFNVVESSVFYHGKEYRFASYLGAKVLECDDKAIVISQGKYRLEAYFNAADNNKNTENMIKEKISVGTHIHFKMFIDGVPYFNLHSENGSVDYKAPQIVMECREAIEI